MSRDRASLIVGAHGGKDLGRVHSVVTRPLVDDIEVVNSRDHFPGGDQIVPAVSMERDESGDWSSAVGHFERFSLHDPGEIAAGVLSKLSDPDPIHVLHDSTWTLVPRFDGGGQ
jgi:hypothetical protein